MFMNQRRAKGEDYARVKTQYFQGDASVVV